jgi:stage IV sporulation protein FB
VFLAEPQRTPYDLNFALAGVPVRVHPMFWLFTVLLGAADPVPLHLLIWVAAVFVSILVHEFGHSLAMRSFGWRSHIVLYSFGGLAIQDGAYGGFERHGRGGRDARTQIIISFAGPLAGFLFAALILAALRAGGNATTLRFGGFGLVTIEPELFVSFPLTLLVYDLLFCNIFWGLLNLLPIYPLDGGQISQQVLVTVNPSDGLRQSFMLSILAAGCVAILGYVKLDSIYMAMLFGYMAYQNYMILQSFRGGGYGGGRGW